MLSNRRTANLACEACIDSYRRYGALCSGDLCLPRLAAIENENTLVLIYGSENRRVMAFRGTDGPQDWKENLWITPQKARKTPSYEGIRPFVPSKPPMIHGGYYSAYSRVSESIKDALEEHSLEGCRWLLTGHSSGGAIASITASLIRQQLPPDVVTFGCPRWGNRHATWLCSQRTRMILRFVNGRDIVPFMPFPLGCWQHGEPAIRLHGSDHADPFKAHRMFDYKTGLIRYND